jgi:hypothetical protein
MRIIPNASWRSFISSRATLTRYLSDNWMPVIEVDGRNALPLRL